MEATLLPRKIFARENSPTPRGSILKSGFSGDASHARTVSFRNDFPRTPSAKPSGRTLTRKNIARCALSTGDRINASTKGGSQNGGNQDPPRRLRVSEMSAEVKRLRAQMEEDEQVASLMRGLRGQNLNDSQFAADDVEMRLIEVQDKGGDGEDLPLAYDPATIAAYWGKRPGTVAQRAVQLLSVTGGFLSNVLIDLVSGKLKDNEVKRACEIREIVTSLGPAYIKLGQALSIRPDVLSPAAMNELQKLCDKVPSFDDAVAMRLIEEELGANPSEIFSELSPSPIAAASLGQVYKGKLRKNGDQVAVKVQRPYVLETVTIDLFIIRRIGKFLRRFPQIATDVVGLVDEWAARFFEELDYVNEASNTKRFADSMRVDLPQVVVPRTYDEYTSRRVIVTGWVEGEKLSQSAATDVGELVNVGVICYLKQLLDTGLFHADPHPGNLIRTPEGQLAVLDFGLMTQITEDQKYGMIEAISHLIHRDYDAIVRDFVLLGFIPEGVNLSPIMPVLAKVFDQALEGGGAKGINFQELAADLAQITFDYPFRIPPYFALIIRAIGVLEGIALVGNPDFAIVDAAYPYIAQRLLTDPSPRLRQALKYTIYGKRGVFDADRFIDVMEAFETFSDNASFGQGGAPDPLVSRPVSVNPSTSLVPSGSFRAVSTQQLASFSRNGSGNGSVRAALSFLLSQEGSFFREFILDEFVKGLDALGREQINQFANGFGLSAEPGARFGGSDRTWPVPALTVVPSTAPPPFVFFPVPFNPALLPRVSEEDRIVLSNMRRILSFLVGRSDESGTSNLNLSEREVFEIMNELLPFLPSVASQLLPQITSRLSSRIAARFIREAILGV